MNKEEFKNYLMWLIQVKSEAMLLLLAEPAYGKSVSINRYRDVTILNCPAHQMLIKFKRLSEQYQEPSFEIGFVDIEDYEESNLDNIFSDLPSFHNTRMLLHEIIRLRDESILDFGVVEEQIYFDADGRLCRVPYIEDEIILSYDLISQKVFHGTRLKAIEECNYTMEHCHDGDDYIPFEMNQELQRDIEILISKLGQTSKTHKKRIEIFLKLCSKPVGTSKVTPMAKIIEKMQQTY